MEEQEAYRRNVIEEERQRLLQQHAAKLLGYLPKGVLRDSTDLEMFDDNFKQAYTKRHTDYLDEL